MRRPGHPGTQFLPTRAGLARADVARRHAQPSLWRGDVSTHAAGRSHSGIAFGAVASRSIHHLSQRVLLRLENALQRFRATVGLLPFRFRRLTVLLGGPPANCGCS